MSWEQLQSIYEQQAADTRDAEARPPVSCPNDGKPLETGPRGELHCTFDGWIWDGYPVRKG